MHRLSHLRILGRNRREFVVSIVVVLAGFVVMFILEPIRARESGGPPSVDGNGSVARAAGWFVFALIGLLCSLNAYRDKETNEVEKHIAFTWNLALCIWMFLLLLHLISWWQELHPSMKPSWLQGN